MLDGIGFPALTGTITQYLLSLYRLLGLVFHALGYTAYLAYGPHNLFSAGLVILSIEAFMLLNAVPIVLDCLPDVPASASYGAVHRHAF